MWWLGSSLFWWFTPVLAEWFVHSLERFHQPAQPRRAGAKAGIVLTPEEIGAAGTGHAPANMKVHE